MFDDLILLHIFLISESNHVFPADAGQDAHTFMLYFLPDFEHNTVQKDSHF